MSLTTREKIDREMEILKKQGKPFCPADVAKKLGIYSKQLTVIIRERDDVKRTIKCSADTSGYRGSIWEFKDPDKNV